MIKSVAKDIAEIQYLPTFRFMGYDSEGLAKVIYWYENEEKKMTREEAMLKIRKANIGPEVAEVNLRILEALGLIKFDETELTPMEIFKKIYNEYKSGLTAEAFVNRLNNEGVFIKK